MDFLKDKVAINILSVFNDKLLISCAGLSELYIINREGRYLATITSGKTEKLRDASWTPQGNIVYLTHRDRVVVMLESGKVIARTHMINLKSLSVSTDNKIYLAVSTKGVYQLLEDGARWSLVFRPTDGWCCCQTIKVTNELYDDFWTLERQDGTSHCHHLRVYSVRKRRPHDNVTWRDIILPPDVVLNHASELSYDGNMNILLHNHFTPAIHMLAVNGEYQGQLLSPGHINDLTYRMVVDRKHQLLYLGQKKGVVAACKLPNRNDYKSDNSKTGSGNHFWSSIPCNML